MEDLGIVVAIIFWVAIALFGKIASAMQKRARETSARGRPQGGPPPVPSLESMLREMARQAGLYQEPAVASEHRGTASEHAPTLSEHRGTLFEHLGTAGEHRQTALEIHQAQMERSRREGEHRATASEHLKGDVVLGPRPTREERTRHRSPFAVRILADLRGRRELARAVVLREILGPPVSLREQ